MNDGYVFDDHNEERQFDDECFVGISWACDEVGRDVSAHDFEDGTLNVRVC